jgi:hypothetical protein
MSLLNNKPVAVKKKQNQNEGNDPKNEITIKPNEVSKTYDGSKTTTPPTEVKEEVKIADANKPKYVPSIKNEKEKGNLVVNQDLMNKKVPKKEKPVVTVKNKSEKGVLEKQLDDNNENKTKNRVKGVLEEEITKEKSI